MSYQNEFVVGTLYINYKNVGRAESYNFGVSTPLDKMQDFKDIIQARLLILPDNAEIVWARLGRVGVRESFAAIDKPETGLAATLVDGAGNNKCDHPNTALHLRYETNLGKWRNFFLNFIPDGMTVDRLYLGSADVDFDGNTVTDPANDGWDTAMENYAQLVGQNTKYQMYFPEEAEGAQYSEDVFHKVIYRGYTSKKLGRPFGLPRGRASITA